VGTKYLSESITTLLPVSIQLMSPASGDAHWLNLVRQSLSCFHSINVPSEWGHKPVKPFQKWLQVSIQLMSPASGDRMTENLQRCTSGFHSINVPSEWGQVHEWRQPRITAMSKVSIQLMSPASGDPQRCFKKCLSTKPYVSIQLMSPASGDKPLRNF